MSTAVTNSKLAAADIIPFNKIFNENNHHHDQCLQRGIFFRR